MAPRLLYGLYFFSGFAALCYEVSWSRQIGLLFGFTVQAASIVLLAYFVGMSLGYGVMSRFADRYRFPLRAYAFLEIAAAGWAMLVPMLIATLGPILGEAALAEPIKLLARGIACFLIFLPTTFSLGATLPFMSRAAAELPHRALLGVPLAYATNTLGAFLGSWVGVFVLFRWVGVTPTSWVGAGLSFTCGIGALLISFPCSEQQSEPGQCPPKWHVWAAVSGFAAISLQVLYTRLFSLVFHNSIYTFGIIVGIFLLAIALGAMLVARYGGSAADKWLPGIAEAAGLSTIVSVILFLLWTELSYFSAGSTFASYIGGALLLVIVIVMPPIILIAAILPLTWRAATAEQSWARASGVLSCTNTLAGAAGAVLTSFLMLEWLGLFGSFTAISALLLGFAFYQRGARKEHFVFFAASLVFVVAFWKYASSLQGLEDDEKVVGSWESAYGWIDVIEFDTGDRQLRQNIHYGMGSTGSIRMERAQTDIPLLLHGQPESILYEGMATGITAGASLQHPDVKKVKVVELIADVVRAAKLFSEKNADITTDERVTIQVGDARHVLQNEKSQFDVIIADLFVPWESQTGYLYTQEHFHAVKSRLKPGGIFCQWLPLWQLSRHEFEMIANTFASAFPKSTIWFGNLDKQWTIVGLIGSEHDLHIDAKIVDSRLFSLRNSREGRPVLNGAKHLWMHYLGDWQASGHGPLNTDDSPLIELDAPISTWSHNGRVKYKVLTAYYKDVLSNLPKQQVTFSGYLGETPTTEAVEDWQLWQLGR